MAFKGGIISTTRFRAVVVSIAAVAALAAVPSSAWACNLPYISLSVTSAGPGDTVHWSIGNADIGAEWDGLRIAGRTLVPPGTVTEPKPHGSFVMPDVGDQAASLSVETTLSHAADGGTWPKSAPLEYRPPSQPPAEGPAEAAPPTETGAPPPVEETPVRRGEPNGNASPGGPARGRGEPGDTRGSRSPEAGAPVSTREPAERAAPVALAASPSAHAPVQAEVQEAATTHRRLGPPRTRHAQAPSPERLARVDAVEPRAIPVRTPAEDDGPLLLLAVGAAAISAAGVLLVLRGGGQGTGSASLEPVSPIPPDALIEAELQEILAEEGHRRLREERGRDPAERGDPIRAGPI